MFIPKNFQLNKIPPKIMNKKLKRKTSIVHSNAVSLQLFCKLSAMSLKLLKTNRKNCTISLIRILKLFLTNNT